jgi:hypothetical protein
VTGLHLRTQGLLVLALLGVGSTACDDVLVATLMDSGVADAMADATPVPCGALDGGPRSCEAGSFCALATCGGSTGTCETIPSSASCADAGYAPECDCDGISYFNDCLRRAHKATYKGPQESCWLPTPTTPMPRICRLMDPQSKCEPTQSCVLLIPYNPLPSPPPSECPMMVDTLSKNLPGTCWVLPDTCPPSSPGGTVHACGSSCAGVDPCKALKDGGLLFSCP